MSDFKTQNFKIENDRKLVIRVARESDAEAYLNLGKSIMDEAIYSLTQSEELNLTIDQEKEWIGAAFKNINHLILIADLDGEIVGQLDFSNGHRKRIAHTGGFGMGVCKSHRGLGIGSMLLKSLIDWAQLNPTIEKINLCVHQTNDRAIEIYKKHGFQVEGRRTKDLKYSSSDYVDTILMGLWVK